MIVYFSGKHEEIAPLGSNLTYQEAHDYCRDHGMRLPDRKFSLLSR